MRTGLLAPWLPPLLIVIGAGTLSPPAGAAETTDSAVQSVPLVMKEYVFLPAQLTFKVGVSYRLHFVNAGKELHEFTAPGFFKSVEAKNPGLLANGGQEVVLQPDATKDFDFVPRKAGYFAVTCADHDWAGMTGGITVE